MDFFQKYMQSPGLILDMLRWKEMEHHHLTELKAIATALLHKAINLQVSPFGTFPFPF
jgi:hypothetical protein